MTKARKVPMRRAKSAGCLDKGGYGDLVGRITGILEAARRGSVRAINAIMTGTYWEIGRRIVEFEQEGRARAEYGEALIERLAADLSTRFGPGFSVRNVWQMKAFYLAWPILQTVSAESEQQAIPQTPPAEFLTRIASRFPLPWSSYVRLLAVKNAHARAFYEAECLRAGWSVRQLDRQIQSQFYERTALSRNKTAMLTKGARPHPGDIPSAEDEVKDPYVLEFLGLRDEYSETELEAALIHHLEAFLLELGGDFCFVGRQRRLRIGDEWYPLSRADVMFVLRGLSFRGHEFGKGNDNVETLSSKFIDNVRFLCLREQIVIDHKMDAGIHDWIGGKTYSI